MKRFYLSLLAIVLFTGQVSAQTQDFYSETINGRLVHFIKAGSSSHSFDKNENNVAMSGGDYGYMKFVVVDGKAWVYSRTGHTGDPEAWLTHTDNSHWAITAYNYTGDIYIPSYISTDGSNKIPVVGIEYYAFHQLPLKGTITLACDQLTTIGYDAFSVLAKDDSYTKVAITTSHNLTINPRAFKNILFLKTQYEAGMTRQTCIDKKYIKYLNDGTERTCLQEVNINSSGDITIEKDAFVYCEGLEKAEIVSTNGYISIGDAAFGCSFVEEEVNATTKALVCHPLDRMWKRTTDLDFIKIQGKVTGIGNLAFAGHVNIKRVEIVDPRTAAESGKNITIGKQAFQDLFHGHGTAKGNEFGIYITGPIEEIKAHAFRSLYYSSVDGSAASDAKGYGAYKPTGTTLNPASIPFNDCLNIVKIDNVSCNLTIGDQAFSDRFVKSDNNQALGTFEINGPVSKIDHKAACINDYTYNDNTSRLRTIKINNSNNTMTIGDRAFQYHMTSDVPADAGSITINSVNEIGVKAFYNNEKAMTVEITNTKDGAADLTINDNAFENNFQHTANNGTLTINGKLNSIGQNAFANGYGLKTAEVNNTGTTSLTIDYQAFYKSMGYNKDNSVQPLFTDGSLTLTGALNSIGTQSFSEMRGLKTFNLTSESRFSIGVEAFKNDITLSEMIYTAGGTTVRETLPDRVTKVGNSAFENTGFQEMTIPPLNLTWTEGGNGGTMEKVQVIDDNVTKYYPENENDPDVYNRNNLLGYKVFSGCTKLESVKIENTATGQATFEECSNLSSVDISQGVKYIESGVFADTPNLKYLKIPKSVEAIGAAIHAGSSVTGDYRIEFLATQPPLAHINAFATKGSSSSDFEQWKAYVVVPWGCVSSYLFCSDNLGFQNVANDLIACEYKLKNTWGTLGMQAHTNIKEYTGEFTTKADGSYGYMDPKLTSLDKTKVRGDGDFTDVYDYRRVGISRNDGVATNAKSVGDNADRDALRQEMLNNIEKKVSFLKHNQYGLTAHVFGLNKADKRWDDYDIGLARLGLIFQFYKDIDSEEPVDEWGSTIDDCFWDGNITRNDFKEKCEALWNELKLSLDRQMHDMELNDFLNNVNLPSIIYGSGNDPYGSSKGIDNFIELFYGAPTLKFVKI